MKRKRSIKISNVALEPVQWQNDSLQIITSASDLKSMDEFLLKKVTPVLTALNKWSESSKSRRRQQSQNYSGGSSSIHLRVHSVHQGRPGRKDGHAVHAPCGPPARAQRLQCFHCFELPLVTSEMDDLGGQELKAAGKCTCF